jgi:hypothetical protein
MARGDFFVSTIRGCQSSVNVTLETEHDRKSGTRFCDRSPSIASVHDLFAKPLTFWRIMR